MLQTFTTQWLIHLQQDQLLQRGMHTQVRTLFSAPTENSCLLMEELLQTSTIL